MTRSFFLKVKSKLRRWLLGAPQVQHDAEGFEFYKPGSRDERNAGFQSYYRENAADIWLGRVPDRYLKIAEMVPGTSVLEIGSADGTQALTLARDGKSVLGIELMPLQFQEAQKLRQHWLTQGFNVKSCEFVNGSIMDNLEALDKAETVLISRVLYHLRADIEPLFKRIVESPVRNVVLVGCPLREARWRAGGDTGDALGKYAYYAAQEGMEDILKKFSFTVTRSEASGNGNDPLVVAVRQIDR
ncbi:class I SAM-dependent methyltransferase [Aestuariivita boseongensis]|uniref:class I SAM-dependent methyltransferase n=1 Tax=Aestuariivita boseongensis TaxID=1470562 RepID=UPI0006815102|nr:class I SAM-dependent methyltransferase [Aestuariivita boseongensis]